VSTFKVVAIPTKIAEQVRATMRAPGYGHPAHREVAKGYGPCRHCLRDFKVGQEERILFTYDPFHELGVQALPGPVFVHAQACARYPENGGFPEDLLARVLTLDVYGGGRQLMAEEHVTKEELAARVEDFWNTDGVEYIHVRDRSAGCYDLRLERRR
jgi:Protein of unknown function (DUF1203)